MIYKEYGTTGMRVSAVGMGCMRFDDADISARRLEPCAALVRHAYDKGINYFDTAPDYCEDQSEAIVGMGLAGLPRESYYLCSKTNFGQLDHPATRGGFFRRLEKSLAACNTEYFDVYHLWCMLNLKSYRKQCDTLYAWFEEAKAQGLVRHIAFSSHMPGEALKAVLAEARFAGMLVGYNAMNAQYRLAGIEDAHARGMGVAIMNPLGGGVIPRQPALFAGLCEGDRAGLNPAQAALRFVAASREVSVTLCGFREPGQVDEACAAIEGLCEAPARTLCAQLPRLLLQSDALCTGCRYCLACPRDVPIPEMMDAYNHRLMGGDAADRLVNYWRIPPERAADCIACGACEEKCTQHLPIIERLKTLAP